MLKYRVFEEKLISDEIEVYVSYGLKCYNVSNENEECVASISDISTDRSFVERLAEKCTEGQLFPIHLLDVVEDFIG